MSFTLPPNAAAQRANAISALPRVVYQLHVESSPNPVTLALWGREGGYAITVNEVDKVYRADVSTVQEDPQGRPLRTIESTKGYVRASCMKLLEYEQLTPGFLHSFVVKWGRDFWSRFLKLTHSGVQGPDGRITRVIVTLFVLNSMEREKDAGIYDEDFYLQPQHAPPTSFNNMGTIQPTEEDPNVEGYVLCGAGRRRRRLAI